MTVHASTALHRPAVSAERPGQRAERPAAGDFAALLDLLPASVPAPPPRPDRRGAEHGDATADRREPPHRQASTRQAAAPEKSPRDVVARAPGEPPAVRANAPSPGADLASAPVLPDTPAIPAGQAPALTAGLTENAQVGVPPAPEASGAPAVPVPVGGAEVLAAGEIPEVPAPSPPPVAASESPVTAPDPPEARNGSTPVPPAAMADVAATSTETPATAPHTPPAEPGTPTASGEAPPAAGAPASDAAGAPTGDAPTAEPAAAGSSVDAAQADAGHGGHGGDRREAHVEPPVGAPAPGHAAPPSLAMQALDRPLDGPPLGPHRAVPLDRAPRAVAQLLHLGSQSGIGHARIALRPVELGGIEIFLQSSPSGLAAQVVAESPEAARMLQQATEDLRRALARHDIELVSLDVSTSSEQQRDDFAARGNRAEFGGGPSSQRRGDSARVTDIPEPISSTPVVLELPDGLLVDVLA